MIKNIIIINNRNNFIRLFYLSNIIINVVCIIFMIMQSV